MLKNDLYTVSFLNHEDGKISAEVVIDPSHRIFGGHFPGQPVLPGVCTVEMVKEIVSEAKGQTYRLKEANNMKFLSLVDPTQANHLFFKIAYTEENGTLKINASASLEDETTTFKVKGVLV